MERLLNWIGLSTSAPTPATTTPAATKQAAMASSSTDKLVIGMDDLMEAWEGAMDSPLNVPDLVKAIEDLELSAEGANDNNIPEHNTMNLLCQFVTLDNVTVMDFVHTKLVNMGEGQESVGAKSEEKDKWSYPKTYQLTKQIMDSTLQAMKNNGIAIQPVERVPSKEKHKIKWSLKLWLFLLVVNCEKKEIKDWASNYSSKLLLELLQDSVTGSSFELLVKDKCDDLVGELLKLVTDDADCAVEHFKERSNVVKICESEMSKEMIQAISKKSNRFYIIPRNGSNEEDTRMYGAFIYLKRSENQPSPIMSLLRGRSEIIEKQLKDAGFKEFLHFDPHTWKLSLLLEMLKLKLKELSKSISMLFLSFYTHGCNGHIRDQDDKYVNIEEILEIMNETDQLKEIPKVRFGANQGIFTGH